MKRCVQAALFTLAILLITAVVIWNDGTSKTEFQLYNRDKQCVILEVEVHAGDKFRLEIEHSFEHVPWYEYYTVQEDGGFNLDAIAVGGYGAGIPAEMGVPTRVEDGLVWMEDINSYFSEFRWITSSQYMKSLTLNGVEIFDFRTLPDASRVTGRIVVKGGAFIDEKQK